MVCYGYIYVVSSIQNGTYQGNLNIYCHDEVAEGTMEVIKNLKDKYNLILVSDHIKEWAKYILDKIRS